MSVYVVILQSTLFNAVMLFLYLCLFISCIQFWLSSVSDQCLRVINIATTFRFFSVGTKSCDVSTLDQFALLHIFESVPLTILIKVPESNGMEGTPCVYCGANSGMFNGLRISIKKSVSTVTELGYSIT